MGAVGFTEIAISKTVGEAFDKARRAAQYEYGHGGYTGTIAEKTSFIEIPVPKGTTAERLVAKAAEARLAWESAKWKKRLGRKGTRDKVWIFIGYASS